MIYSVTINNKAIIDNSLLLSLQQTYLLSGLHSIVANWANMSRLNYEGLDYYWLSYPMIIEQLPLLRIKRKDGQHEHIKKDTLYGLFKELAKDGFLIAHPENQKQGRAYYGFAPKMYLLFGKNNTVEASANKSTPTYINPHTYGYKSTPSTDKSQDNDNTNYNSNYTNKKQLFTGEPENLQAVETVKIAAHSSAPVGGEQHQLAKLFAQAVQDEMSERAGRLPNYASSIYRHAADDYLCKVVMNAEAAAQTCYRQEKARENLTLKVAQAFAEMLFNRFEGLLFNGQLSSRFVHTSTTFLNILSMLCQYPADFICDVLAEATRGGWDTPKSDAGQLADKYNKWIFTHKQTENLTKVREKVESADKGAKNAFQAAADELTSDEMEKVFLVAKKNKKINKRSSNTEIKAAARRAYAVVMYMRTKDTAFNNTNDDKGIPMGLEAERAGDAVYNAAYGLIKANHQNW